MPPAHVKAAAAPATTCRRNGTSRIWCSIKARNATLAIILQPTAFDQALWRLSFFREQRATDVAYGSDQARLVKLAGLAATKALSDQAEADLPAVCDVTERSRSAWKFNQELLERINTHHVAYWNAPLTHARSGR